MNLERNVFGILERTARSRLAGRPAFGFPGGVTISFAELHQRSLQLGRAFVASGLRKGDRVAILMNSRREWIEAYFAIAAVGAVCVPVNTYLVAAEVDTILRDCDARFLIYDDEAADRVRRLTYAPELSVVVSETPNALPDLGAIAYEDFVDASDPSIRFSGPDLSDPFVIYYSSGTTGAPKGALHSHNGVLWNAMGQWLGFELDGDVRYGIVPSLSWAAGFNVLVTALVWIGGFSYVRPTGGATAESVVDMLITEKITHVNLVPSLLTDIMRRPDLVARLGAGSLQWVLVGSAPVPLTLLEQASAALPDVAVVQGYGFSEFPALVSVLRREDAAEHPGSAGRPLPMVSVAVRTADDVVEHSGTGELLVRSPATMIGYHNRPDETDRVFREGWLHTGDLAEVDGNGFVTILGRTNDMIISGGLNVYPKEIEDVVIRIDGVLECAVVAVPHDRFGEAVAVSIYTDMPSFDPESVAVACREQLASYKRPKHVVMSVNRLPRNSNGKLLKREITRQMITELGLS
ncbi:class I adenylate-forming enzyme family protein [Rhodococcus erythropolis]